MIDADLSDISNTEMDESDTSCTSSPRCRLRKLIQKYESLVRCFCAKCNLSIRRTENIFVIGAALVHDIVCAWDFFCVSHQMISISNNYQLDSTCMNQEHDKDVLRCWYIHAVECY